MKSVRCAIYTRKSSDEGLEQDFNSLDAQREACGAYILSQASEGWTALPDRYDDGGISGGTLERPALKRLLADVIAGRIDIIVVYKVDRLSRSLFDFAKLVEQFEKTGTSFVSVTQSFNTTTSMGRLTLNMLLSFAQFEREVTAERIRDKIAASKAKGMWMGGTPPVGYAPNGRTLTIVESEAQFVREIYRRYLELGNARLLGELLARERITSPKRLTSGGKPVGGAPITRGQIYAMLQNPIYVGLIAHKGRTFPGQHAPLMERSLWDAVQAKLEDNRQGHHSGVRAEHASLLAGKVVDCAGTPLKAVHSTKGPTRYRYYAAFGQDAVRIPARELESAVMARVHQAFEDPLALAAECGLALSPADLTRLHREGNPAGRISDRTLVKAVVSNLRVGPDAIEIECEVAAIAEHLALPLTDATPMIQLHAPARLTRSGRVMKLVHDNGQPLVATPDATLARLLAKAHHWWRELRSNGLDLTAYAVTQGITRSYMQRVVKLAFLSPQVTDALLTGRHSTAAGIDRLTSPDAIPASWSAQAKTLLVAAAD